MPDMSDLPFEHEIIYIYKENNNTLIFLILNAPSIHIYIYMIFPLFICPSQINMQWNKIFLYSYIIQLFIYSSPPSKTRHSIYIYNLYLLVVQVSYRVLIFKYFRINCTHWWHVLHLTPTSESDSEPLNCGGAILEVHTLHSYFWYFTHFQSTNPRHKKISNYLWSHLFMRLHIGNQPPSRLSRHWKDFLITTRA